MNLIIVPDIFGWTPALSRLRQRLEISLASVLPAGNALSAEIVDPYGDRRHFKDEALAYAHFTRRMDIPAYANLVSRRLRAQDGPVCLLGFSAGASALWYLSGEGGGRPVTRTLGFYGSQIRHFPDIMPRFDMHLVFPASEPHFEVDSLMGTLAGRTGLTCTRSRGGHGFMNPYSRNFDPGLYKVWADEKIPALLC